MNRVRRVAVAALLMMVSAATAHDLHQSTGGAEYNPDTKRLEVSLTFFADDLELALIRFSERMISLREAETEKADAVIQAYLNQTFVLTEADGCLQLGGARTREGRIAIGRGTRDLVFRVVAPLRPARSHANAFGSSLVL